MQPIDADITFVEYIMIIILLGLPVFLSGLFLKFLYLYKKRDILKFKLSIKIIIVSLFQIMSIGLTVIIWNFGPKLPEPYFMLFDIINSPALFSEIIMLMMFIFYFKVVNDRLAKTNISN